MARTDGYTLDDNEFKKKNNDKALFMKDGSSYYSAEDANTDNAVPVMCDRVYPKYMAIEDLEWAKDNKIDKLNTFRCAYAKTCNIPWTEAGCN